MLLLKKGLFIYKTKLVKKYSKLQGNCFSKGSVLKTTVLTPKKPNSARRPVAKIILSSGVHLLSYIPGIGHNLRKHASSLIRGGGARDLPMVSYTCVRGVYDLIGVVNRLSRRSIYGIKKTYLFSKKFKRI